VSAPDRSPRVSLGLPVFNGERYLQQTLDALLAQTYADFELVIADNASTDSTEEICRAYAGRDARIRYHRSDENRGATWNFNRAFTLCSAGYFKWSAYDDLCEPLFLERCVPALDAAPRAVLVYPKTRLIDENGRVARDHEDGLALLERAPHDRLRRLVRALGYANATYGLIRSSALRRTRLLGSYPSADYVLLAELALLGEFVELPERLFLRRIHPQMSRQAHPSAADAATWFRPQAHSRVRAEAWRLCIEHMISISRAPLPASERLRCFLTFADAGGRRYWDHLARELWELTLLAVRPARELARKLASTR
jgi:glycosyltransferase involved in cell wall biosynthesis